MQQNQTKGTTEIGNVHIPIAWMREYLVSDPNFASFVQKKASEADRLAVTKDKPVIQVIDYKQRFTKSPDILYAERSKVLPLSTLLAKPGIDINNLETEAAVMLNTTEPILKIVPRYRRCREDLCDTTLTFFVSMSNLVGGSKPHRILCALQNQNYSLALYFLRSLTKPLSNCTPRCLHDMLLHAVRSDSIEIYQLVSTAIQLTGFPEGSDILWAIAESNSCNILRYLAELHPDKVQELASRAASNGEPPIHAAVRLGHAGMVEILLEYTDDETMTRFNCGNMPLLAMPSRMVTIVLLSS